MDDRPSTMGKNAAMDDGPSTMAVYFL
jgi:hypothetical protein